MEPDDYDVTTDELRNIMRIRDDAVKLPEDKTPLEKLAQNISQDVSGQTTSKS